MKTLAVLLLTCLLAGTALAQDRQRPPQKAAMKQEERQRLREDMRDAYRERGAARQERHRQMSPQERERLRHDVQDANRQMKR